MATSSIHIERERNGLTDSVRAYRILLDGVLVGEVKRGRSRTLVVERGHHELRLGVDFMRSPVLHLELATGEEARVRCWPNAKPPWNLYWLVFRRSRYIGIERLADSPL
jgi:hypothetical protein